MQKIIDDFYGKHDFVQTSPCGRGEHHPHNLVGSLWRIEDPESVRVGHCFLEGRLKKGDLFLGIEHSGDCFQTYMYVEEYGNGFDPSPNITFGSYGIGDSKKVDLSPEGLAALKSGKFFNKPKE